ncbi:MAG: hypothetical protein BWK80_36075 [Desulfobacteraceae bacterium IS3]|nr:MAG: hypothetical protein BWK80_36075 [Desulfobacteraceae bacterium IS3]
MSEANFSKITRELVPTLRVGTLLRSAEMSEANFSKICQNFISALRKADAERQGRIPTRSVGTRSNLRQIFY